MNDAFEDDATWDDDDEDGLWDDYCLTLVRGISAEEFLRRIGARPGPRVTGVSALREETRQDSHTRMGIGVTEVDGWALGFETCGIIGISEKYNVPLSAGTRLVADFQNVNAVTRFVWREDGDLRLDFDPGDPGVRRGSDPDGLLDVLTAAGFSCEDTTDEDDDEDDGDADLNAVIEHLTGIRVTDRLIARATYLTGTVGP
ncbi:hypothetical protein EDD29_4747 [Actinocorallia herbida]|uniref:Uncharacterized protein n=1 Tax=Actinocorallia herbida TaxID=58109 RepID=A0A3N1D0U5_9ACTN|nr:DUF6461 domain-containing protein [Actinocorallia herbida]ROO87155.1 hypothetical protein EDD29_4747 [Actinocorallia herbida]